MTAETILLTAGYRACYRELMSLARHWEQFDNDQDRERAATLRDALRMLRTGWGCTDGTHTGEGIDG